MTPSDLRKKIRSIILGLTGLIIALIFMRVVIDFLDPNAKSGFARFMIDLTDIFINPMEGLIELSTASEIDQINLTAILAIFIYFVAGLILAEVITAFIYDNIADVILNVVDAIFKIVEFILFLRIIFDLLEVNKEVSMVQTIYTMTDWAEEAIVSIKLLDDRLDISIILVLIFVVILDIVSEGMLKGVLTSGGSSSTLGGGGSSSNQVQNVTHVYAPPPPKFDNSSMLPQPTPQRQPIQQNITVNVPPPPPPQPVFNINQPSNAALPPKRTVFVPNEVNSPAKAVQNAQRNPEPQKYNPNGFAAGGYTVQSVPSRFKKTTIYGETPKGEKKSISSRFKKFFGS